MAGDRMSRIWSPGLTIGRVAVAAFGESEFRMVPSTSLIFAQDREIRDFTVTRIVGRLMVYSAVEGSGIQCMWGARIANQNEVIGTIGPGTDQTADWMMYGGVSTSRDHENTRIADAIDIDSRSQRKSRGMESELRFYMQNIGVNTMQYEWVGRVLILVP